MFWRARKQTKSPSPYNVFISYAHEDHSYARQLAKELTDRGVTVWFDESNLDVGASITASIQESLQRSEYMIAILGANYLDKDWPQRELNIALHEEMAKSRRILIPILHDISLESAIQHVPALYDRLAVQSSVGIQKVVHSIMRVIRGPSDFPEVSPRLAHYMAEVELKTGRRIQMLDIQKHPGKESTYMPGTSPPSFSIDPDFHKRIRVYFTPNILSSNEAEATLANLLTIIDMDFEGFPFCSFSPMRGRMLGQSPMLSLPEIDAVQKWLYNALLNVESERRIQWMNFRRYELQARVIERISDSSCMTLSLRARSMVRAIDIAVALFENRTGLLPSGLNVDTERLKEECPADYQEAMRILDILKKEGTRSPTAFRSCLKAILRLWGLDEFVIFGYVDRRTGYVRHEYYGVRGLLNLQHELSEEK